MGRASVAFRSRPDGAVHFLHWRDAANFTDSPAIRRWRRCRTDMNTITPINTADATPRTVADVAKELGPIFARRATDATDEDQFVAENFTLLKSSGLVDAGVPKELGGAGASIDELATMLRTIAHHCGSTALAFSMHTHQVAIPAWRWTHQKVAAVEPLLKRIAQEKIVLLSSGGSDWIAGSGKAEKVEGGYKITARKIFSSGA